MNGGNGVKISLSVSDESYEEVRNFLEERNFVICDDAPYILLQKDIYPEHIGAKDKRGEKSMIPVSDIVTIESYGHTIEIHTLSDIFTTSERLYQLEKMLDPNRFLRVSNSVIISRTQVARITPTLSMKFILKMKDGSHVDVTRGYYNKFRDAFGI